MRKIVVSILVTALALGAIYGAVLGGAATLTLGGVDDLDSDSVVTAIATSTCTMTGINCTVE